MITEIKADKLLVISDLHVGNPFSKAKRNTIEFLHWASRNGYDVCINGDGFEIAQVSFPKLARDIPEVFHALKQVTQNGRTVYYVVGNHDILLENFLNDWGGFKVAPFLNVWSGEKRFRIEHGHLYDPFFVRSPGMYEFLTWLAGFPLKLHPSLYYLWIRFEKFKARFFKPSKQGIVGEHPSFIEAANELLQRGFDGIIFGHTHHVGEVRMDNGKFYINTGSWLMGTDYAEISNGQVVMKRWSRIG